jgi:hypothetical protein
MPDHTEIISIVIEAVPQPVRQACPGGWLEFTMVPVLDSAAEVEHVPGTPVTVSVSAGIDGEVRFVAGEVGS